jgi:hypothetical protein
LKAGNKRVTFRRRWIVRFPILRGSRMGRTSRGWGSRRRGNKSFRKAKRWNFVGSPYRTKVFKRTWKIRRSIKGIEFFNGILDSTHWSEVIRNVDRRIGVGWSG